MKGEEENKAITGELEAVNVKLTPEKCVSVVKLMLATVRRKAALPRELDKRA